MEICIRQIALVDDTLEELGTPKEYRKLRESVTWLLFVWLGIVCAAYAGDSLWCIEMYNDIRAMIIPILMDYPIHVNTFTDMTFVLLVR